MDANPSFLEEESSEEEEDSPASELSRVQSHLGSLPAVLQRDRSRKARWTKHLLNEGSMRRREEKQPQRHFCLLRAGMTKSPGQYFESSGVGKLSLLRCVLWAPMHINELHHDQDARSNTKACLRWESTAQREQDEGHCIAEALSRNSRKHHVKRNAAWGGLCISRKSRQKLPQHRASSSWLAWCASASVFHRPFRKMATGRAHGATFRSRGADSERSHLICILRAADGSNF